MRPTTLFFAAAYAVLAGCSPEPESPMTANFSESSLFGIVSGRGALCCAGFGACGAAADEYEREQERCRGASLQHAVVPTH